MAWLLCVLFALLPSAFADTKGCVVHPDGTTCMQEATNVDGNEDDGPMLSLMQKNVRMIQRHEVRSQDDVPVWQRTPNEAISGRNNKHMSGSEQDCKDACLASTEFLCKSFDYHKQKRACDLSDTSGVHLKSDYAGNPYDHYARTEDCIKGPWNDWSCCSHGQRQRSRLVASTLPNMDSRTYDCENEATQSEPCPHDTCVVDCVWGEWQVGKCWRQTVGHDPHPENCCERSESVSARNGGAACRGAQEKNLPC